MAFHAAGCNAMSRPRSNRSASGVVATLARYSPAVGRRVLTADAQEHSLARKSGNSQGDGYVDERLTERG
jgi:hypothetical protein